MTDEKKPVVEKTNIRKIGPAQDITLTVVEDSEDDEWARWFGGKPKPNTNQVAPPNKLLN